MPNDNETPILLKDYNLVIKEDGHHDMKDIILLQPKGVYRFSGSEYFLADKSAVLELSLSDGLLHLIDFPTQLMKLIQKDDARFVILELDESTAANLRGTIYFPAFIRNIRRKTGGRKIKQGEEQYE